MESGNQDIYEETVKLRYHYGIYLGYTNNIVGITIKELWVFEMDRDLILTEQPWQVNFIGAKLIDMYIGFKLGVEICTKVWYLVNENIYLSWLIENGDQVRYEETLKLRNYDVLQLGYIWTLLL